MAAGPARGACCVCGVFASAGAAPTLLQRRGRAARRGGESAAGGASGVYHRGPRGVHPHKRSTEKVCLAALESRSPPFMCTDWKNRVDGKTDDWPGSDAGMPLVLFQSGFVLSLLLF